jgi:hypothetical protein
MAPTGLPVFSALTDLVTSTFTDQFKKLIQPAPLVAASIFATLQFVLFYPPLAEHYPAITWWIASLPTVWQVVLGTLLFLSLGYLLGSLSDFFLSVASGSALHDSPLVGAAMIKRQQNQFKNATKIACRGGAADDTARARALRRLAYQFPRAKEDVAPTRLGNVLANLGDYTWHQYGAAFSVVWPLLDLKLKEKNEALRSQLDDNRTALAFLATMSVLMGLVAVEIAIVNLVQQQPLPALLGAILFAVVAYLVYAAGVLKAEAWSRGVRTAFDLYLEEVGTELGLRAHSERDAEQKRKERWEKVSRWLTYGATKINELGWEVDQQEHDWYAPPTPAAPTPPVRVQHPSTVSVEQWGQARRGAAGLRDTHWVFGQVAEYLFLASNAAAGAFAPPAHNVVLLVTDPALDTVPLTVEGTLSGGASSTQPTQIIGDRLNGEAPALRWKLGDIAPGGSATLQYQIHRVEVAVTVDSPFTILSLEERERNQISLRIRNGGLSVAQCTIIVDTPLDRASPSSLNYGSGLAAMPLPPASPCVSSWQTEPIDARSEFDVLFRRQR